MQYAGDKVGRQRFWSSLRSLAAATALAIATAISLPAISFADEDGVSFWIPGFFGSLAAVPQQPGWSFTAVNYYTPVSASGAVAAAREITIGRLNPTVNVNQNVSVTSRFEAVIINPGYVFATPVLGGQLDLGIAGIVGNDSTTLNGNLTLASGPLRHFAAGQHQRLRNGQRGLVSASLSALEQWRAQLDSLWDGRYPRWPL
jgi:hypothetical protein